MTLDECCAHIGDDVIYTAQHGAPEHGWITSTNAKYAFVRFANRGAEACRPDDLTLRPEDD